MAKIHYGAKAGIGPTGDVLERMACANFWSRGRITKNPEEVTCKKCIKIMQREGVI